MKQFLSLFIILAIISCAGHNEVVDIAKYKNGMRIVFNTLPVRWSFHCEYPEGHKDIVRKAFRYWDDLTDEDLFVESKLCGLHQYKDSSTGIAVYTTNMVYMNGNRNTWGIAQHFFDHAGLRGAIIFFKPWLEGDQISKESIARHEIGHIIGFKHSKVVSCLMYDFIYESVRSPRDKVKNVCSEELKIFLSLYGSPAQQERNM